MTNSKENNTVLIVPVTINTNRVLPLSSVTALKQALPLRSSDFRSITNPTLPLNSESALKQALPTRSSDLPGPAKTILPTDSRFLPEKTPMYSKPVSQPLPKPVAKSLPDTSENLFLITLMGMLATLTGLFAKLFRRRPQD
jgi:LPXTG-motif cell wall-anchored protein